jgi:hypothetical protein
VEIAKLHLKKIDAFLLCFIIVKSLPLASNARLSHNIFRAIKDQCLGSAFVFADPDPDKNLNADPDPSTWLMAANRMPIEEVF